MDSLKALKPVEIEIILDYDTNVTLLLNELLIFPHGLDGLHIWEAGIVLARFAYYNCDLFAGRSVLELGTGVGVAGIAVLKYSECKELTVSDYKSEILKNVEGNIKKNKLAREKNSKAVLLDWREYEKFNEKYDVIIGSDVIYIGSPIKELASLIDKALNVGGSAYILIPTQRSAWPDFLKAIQETGNFELSEQFLEDGKYLTSPIADEKEGFRHFAGLKELGFYVHTSQKSQVKHGIDSIWMLSRLFANQI